MNDPKDIPNLDNKADSHEFGIRNNYKKFYTFKHNKLIASSNTNLPPSATIYCENPQPPADTSHIPDSIFEKLTTETL
jgi:hypothetical protein